MNITHIIGNGFDINQGIPTSYAHFYEYYLQLLPKDDDPEVVKQFRKQMESDLKKKQTELWSDMEIALGRVTENYKEAGDFETAYLDVYKHLMEYIEKAYSNSEVARFDTPERTLYQDIMKPWLHLVPRDVDAVERSFLKNGDNHIRILSFNYTDTINRISDIGKKQGSVLALERPTSYYYDGYLQIHQSIAKKNIILGVDNIAQITNGDLANDERISNLLVKPQTNRGLGTLIDRQCREVIEKSDIISLFGVSLGPTDKTWWNEIGKRIKNNLDVIILYFPFVKEINQYTEIEKITLREDKKRELMNALGIDPSNYKNYMSRIFVNFSNNPGQRNIFSNPKKANLGDNFNDVMFRFQKEGIIRKPVEKPHDRMSLKLMTPIDDDQLFKPKLYRERTISYDKYSAGRTHIKTN